MDTAIITAIITAVVTLAVCLINSWVTIRNVNNANQAHVSEVLAQSQQTIAIIELKLESLEASVNKHNQVISRTYECEKQIGILQTKVEGLEKSE